ncbi:MAG: cytochrome c oxidase subunit II [Gammaproteobacteria bacterium]|nr:cytochrome c oxidase subunit II [Gammaproteobacteria bacterium]
MSTTTLKRGLGALGGVGGLLAAGRAAADWGALNMPTGVTPVSGDVYSLHMLILWICVAIGVVVFGAIIYSVIKYRKSKGAQAAQFHENTAVEVVWTIIPFLILVGMAIPATKTLVVMEKTGEADLTVKVTGYQWKWRYEYIDDGVSFFSNLATPRAQIYEASDRDETYLLEVDKPLVLPAGRKIRFLFTGADVIHSWWVPDLGFKKDAIPGFINEMWARIDEPGVYRGQCAELCGKDHGFMPVVVEAKTPDEFQSWLEQQKVAMAEQAQAAEREWTRDELMKRGSEVYRQSCQACHQANGEGVPGTFPAIKGGAIATGDLDKHIDTVMSGVSGTAMQAFENQLDDADLAAVITYERNAFGNNTGDVVQPADIKAAR